MHLVCMCVFFRTKELGGISVTPTNTEKYISFSWRQFTFVDSLAFLNASLKKLTQSTPAGAFHLTTRGFEDVKERELMMRKGIYPHEYITSMDKFKETQLSPQDVFYSSPTSSVSFLPRLCVRFCAPFCGSFLLLILLLHYGLVSADILLLHDIFQNFRCTALSTRKLDPAHYLTPPGFSWDALLKETDIELDLLSDIDMHQFIEHGLRGA